MMDVTEIQKYLPHRYPFLMVDRVLELNEDKSIVALKNVTYNEQIFLGHFPATPVFPGVLIVEAMAQAAGILAFKSRNRTLDDGYIYYLAGTDKTKFTCTGPTQYSFFFCLVLCKRTCYRQHQACRNRMLRQRDSREVTGSE